MFVFVPAVPHRSLSHAVTWRSSGSGERHFPSLCLHWELTRAYHQHPATLHTIQSHLTVQTEVWHQVLQMGSCFLPALEINTGDRNTQYTVTKEEQKVSCGDEAIVQNCQLSLWGRLVTITTMTTIFSSLLFIFLFLTDQDSKLSCDGVTCLLSLMLQGVRKICAAGSGVNTDRQRCCWRICCPCV